MINSNEGGVIVPRLIKVLLVNTLDSLYNNEVQEQPPQPHSSRFSPKLIFLVVSLWLISLLWMFGAGIVVKSWLEPQNPPNSATQPTPIVSEKNQTVTPRQQNNIEYIMYSNPKQGPQWGYFSDTLTVYVQSSPPQLLIASYLVTQGNTNTFTHGSRVSYFDGAIWHRNTHTQTSPTSEFVSSPVISALHIFQDKNRVLRQRIDMDVIIDGTAVSVHTNTLENESTVRTEPTYTRLFSDGTGTVSINGTSYPAKILYTKWYSMDQSSLNFYNEQYGLKTHVFDFWADDGSVLHLDATQVKNPDEKYSSHQLGIYKDKQGRVAKTFSVGISTDQSIPPNDWNVDFKEPLNLKFRGATESVLKRAEGENYNWFRGMLKGEIQLENGEKVNGIGTFEYIDEL